MKTSTFERALAQDANMTPLRGESLGASVKSNPHCHCYRDLKGTIKRNPHCMAHGTATKGHPFMNGTLSGSGEWATGLAPIGLATAALYVFDKRSPGKLPVDLASMNPAMLLGGIMLAGYAYGGLTAAL